MKKRQGIVTVAAAGLLILSGLLLWPASSRCGENVITASTLTPQQIEKLGLTEYSDLLVYEYNAENPFERLEIWIEVYENGKLVEPRLVSLTKDRQGRWRGKFAVLVTKSPQLEYRIIDLETGVPGTAGSTACYVDNECLKARIQKAFLVDDREIPLGYSAFGVGTGEERMNLGRVEDCTYAHVVKLRFT